MHLSKLYPSYSTHTNHAPIECYIQAVRPTQTMHPSKLYPSYPYTHKPCTHRSYVQAILTHKPCTHRSYIQAIRPTQTKLFDPHKPCTHRKLYPSCSTLTNHAPIESYIQAVRPSQTKHPSKAISRLCTYMETTRPIRGSVRPLAYPWTADERR